MKLSNFASALGKTENQNGFAPLGTLQQRSLTGVNGASSGAPKYAWGEPLRKGSRRCITNLSH